MDRPKDSAEEAKHEFIFPEGLSSLPAPASVQPSRWSYDPAAGVQGALTISAQGGSRLVSFPPYTTAPPLALDPHSTPTHTPQGDTNPPVLVVAKNPEHSLQSIFSATVMETLNDLEMVG